MKRSQIVPEPEGHAIEVIEQGTLLSVPGLKAVAVASGVKPDELLDLSVITSEVPLNCSAVFTVNKLSAAPVRICKKQLAKTPLVKTIVTNSGNANALTGERGERDAAAMQAMASELFGEPALVLSTGVIGVPLDMAKITAGMQKAVHQLAGDIAAGESLARAMATTDTCLKTCAVRVQLPAAANRQAQTVTVGGVAKGSGMIHPNMATMLAVIATDAQLSAEVSNPLLKRVVDCSFHEISVDGETSTNDSVLLLAKQDEGSGICEEDPSFPLLERAVQVVADTLAAQIVFDGEGRTRVLDIVVQGGNSEQDAKRVVKAIAVSPLVKTALAGGDPNWGRVFAAAANAGVPLNLDDLELTIDGVCVFSNGGPNELAPSDLASVFQGDHVHMVLNMGSGSAVARMRTTDLTKEYVAINSEYTT